MKISAHKNKKSFIVSSGKLFRIVDASTPRQAILLALVSFYEEFGEQDTELAENIFVICPSPPWEDDITDWTGASYWYDDTESFLENEEEIGTIIRTENGFILNMDKISKIIREDIRLRDLKRGDWVIPT